MSRASEIDRSIRLACPKCGAVATADPIQLKGRCSLICPFCGHHFYITQKINGIAEVEEGVLLKDLIVE